MKNLKIFIGYDSRQDLAYKVAEKSIKLYNQDIPIIPIVQTDLRLKNIYYRDSDSLASTEFTLTRFLTPYLSNYKGWSLFIDCDVLLLDDIQQLFNLRDSKYAVQVVKHDYKPKNSIKMDGKQQTQYPRKNWSSVMLFNNEHPAIAALTKEYVNNATPSDLHRFAWLKDEYIGNIPISWNWLVGWYVETATHKPKLLHYTDGGPWFAEYSDCLYSKEWKTIKDL